MYSIQKHLAFNLWANRKMVDMLLAADETFVDAETSSSFPSIKKTLYHIWDAEVIWFTRIKGGQITTWPSESFKGSFKEAMNEFVGNSSLLQSFMTGKDRAFLDKPITYKNLKGTEYTQPVEEILFHLVNHGSFHRGQIISMMRALGHTAFQSTDLITYLRMQQ